MANSAASRGVSTVRDHPAGGFPADVEAAREVDVQLTPPLFVGGVDHWRDRRHPGIAEHGSHRSKRFCRVESFLNLSRVGEVGPDCRHRPDVAAALRRGIECVVR
jgi:hypothetical protein